MDENERLQFRKEATLDFGEKLKRERLGTGLSQEALGEKAGLHQKHVGYLERGIRTPELPTILLLAKALGVSPSRLIDPDDAGD